MGTAFVATSAIAFAVAAIFALAAPLVEKGFDYPRADWWWAVASAVSICLYILSESFLRGQQRFHAIGSYKLYGSAVFLAASLVMLFLMGIRTLESYVLPFILHNLFFFAFALKASGLGRIRATREAWRKLLGFGAFQMLTWLFSTLLFTGDLFFVARFGTDYEVGVYSVYQTNIRALCTILFHDVFAVVFLPMIAAMDLRRVDRLVVRYAAPIALGVFAAVGALATVLALIFGKSVPLDWTYVALSAAGVSLNTLYLLMTSVVSLDGAKASRLAFVSLLVPLPLLVGMQYYAIAEWGVLGGMASVALLNLALIVVFRLAVRFVHAFQPVSEKGVRHA